MFCIILPIDNFVLRVFPLLKFYVHEFFFFKSSLENCVLSRASKWSNRTGTFSIGVNIFTSKEIEGSDLSKFLKSLQAFNLFLQMFKELCRVTLGKDISCLTFRAVTTTSSRWGKYAVVCYVSFFYERIMFCRNG